MASVHKVLVSALMTTADYSSPNERFRAISEAAVENGVDFWTTRSYVLARAVRSFGFHPNSCLMEVCQSGKFKAVLEQAVKDAKRRHMGGDRCPKEILNAVH